MRPDDRSMLSAFSVTPRWRGGLEVGPGAWWIAMVLAVMGVSSVAVGQTAGEEKSEVRAEASKEEPVEPPPWERRVSVATGGAGWQHEFNGIQLQGFEARAGVDMQWRRDMLFVAIGLDGVDVIQGAGDVESNTAVASVYVDGYRKVLAGVLSAGLGFRLDEVILRPYGLARVGLVVGPERTRADFRIITDTEETRLGTVQGYDVWQTIVLQGMLTSPALVAEVGIEPIQTQAMSLGLGVVVSKWPSNDTVSAGVILRLSGVWRLWQKGGGGEGG